MSYFQSFYQQAPVAGTDARQTKMFIERMKEDEKRRKDEAKALAEDQKRLGMIAQGMGLEKGEVDSMSRGELSGFIQNRMNETQQAQNHQKFLMDIQNQALEAQKVANSTSMANAQNMFAQANLEQIKAKERALIAQAQREKNTISGFSEVLDNFLKPQEVVQPGVPGDGTILKRQFKDSLSPEQRSKGNFLQSIMNNPGIDNETKSSLFSKFAPGVMGSEQKAPKKNISTEKLFNNAFADLEKFRDGGGEVSARVKIDKINLIKNKLETGEVETGTLNQFIGGIFEKVMDAKSVSARQGFEQILQQTLKQTLGAQFTAQEAENYFARGYDPDQPPEQNIQKLKDALLDIESWNNYQLQRFSALSDSVKQDQPQVYLDFLYNSKAPSFFGSSGTMTSSGNQGNVIDLGGGTKIQQLK